MSASRRMGLRLRGLAIATVFVAGCFAKPDLSQITCKTDQQCSPGYRCDLSRNKCSQITDSAAVQDVPDVRSGVADSPGDGRVEADQTSPGDVAGIDQVKGDALVFESGGPGLGDATDVAIPDLSGGRDGLTADLASDGRAHSVPDVPTASPEAQADIGTDRTADLELPADVRAPDAPDLGPDAGPDLGPNAGPDLGPDLGPDSPPGGAIGDSCSKPSDCAKGNCVDGVCCDSPCTGVCQSCALDSIRGVCSLVTGSPASGHGSRKGSGTCGGRCNGKSAACYYPWDETSCGAASCSPESGGATSQRTCDGDGGCSPAATTPCGNYACGTSACLTSCTSPADCVTGAVCVSGGVCTPCATGETVCGNTCVNLKTDNNHCGSCSATPCGAGRQCSGGACLLADGQPCAASSDCASHVCNMFYYDGDLDGYPISTNSIGYCTITSSPNSGYLPARSDGRWDCCDGDSTVNPGVTDYFISKNTTCDTWDWNCSGQPEKKQVELAGDCTFDSSSSTCASTTTLGYPSADCGGAYTYSRGCAVTTPGNCTSTSSHSALVPCH
jgi:hypothetical protein